MASRVPKIGADECVGGENVTAYSEDERKNKNVGRPEVIEDEPSVNKDSPPQLDLNVSPPSQKECLSAEESRKAKASFPHYGGCNSDPAQSEECTTAFSRPKRPRKTLLSSRDTTSRNHEMVPQTANSVHSLPSVNEDHHELWNNNPAQDEGHTSAFADEESSFMSSSSWDTTTCNFGRAPLIWDFFGNSDWRLPLVNEDAYGGGMSTRDDQRETIVQSGNASQDNGASAAEVSSTVHSPEPKSTPTQDLLAVYPPQPTSIRQVNPTVEITDKSGGCFPWRRK